MSEMSCEARNKRLKAQLGTDVHDNIHDVIRLGANLRAGDPVGADLELALEALRDTFDS